MDVSDLREFLALAKRGSFVEAAEDCFITQSTLSKHIKRLETELGCTLFTRTSARVALSPYGKLLIPYAERIAAADSACRQALRNYERKLHETLSIGSTPLMVPYGITNAISGFRKNYPSSPINIVEGETTQLLEKIQSREIKLAFCLFGEREDQESNHALPGLIKIPYCSDILSAVLPLDHPLASMDKINIHALTEETFIFFSENTALYDLCHNYCTACCLEPDIYLTSPRGQSIVEMVGQNMGISIMPLQQVVHVKNSGVVAVPLTPTGQLNIYFVYLKTSTLSDMELLFLNYVRKITSDQKSR